MYPNIIYGDDGQPYEIVGGHRPPPPVVDVDVDFDWRRLLSLLGSQAAQLPYRAAPPMRQAPPPRHLPPPSPPRRAAPRGRPALPPQLVAAIKRHARIPGHAAVMIRLIRGNDGRPKVGLDDGYGEVELGDLEEIVLGSDFVLDDFGEDDFGDDGEDYGRVGDPMAPREIIAFLRMINRAQRAGRRLEFQSWQLPNREIRGDYRIPAGRAPAPTGQLGKVPMYTTSTGTNPRLSFTVPGGSAGAVVATATLTTRPYNYRRYRIVGLETNFGDRSSGCSVVLRYLRVEGADVNLILNDSAAYSDADDWSGDIETSPGLRTGEGTVVDKNGVANIEIGITGDDGDTATGTIKLIVENLGDVVSTQRNSPVGG